MQKIKKILREKLSASYVEVIDQSHLHAGHSEAKSSGGGHYSVLVISQVFKDKTTLERHRMIYQALSEEFKTSIHALAIKAYTPEEYSQEAK